ncbi:AAA family ATPase [Agromyces protaetiae]|uniref:AAA family ATPase n=1 Tax=Agromyces protaetiae TaxID=2509455 RepID=A0A4P6FCU5_9MICO|nr:AAA family ATPase [Agromyces protaetiae]QAY74120.1 AAA family ATPase [Agromyces protaetiae]
MPPADVPRRVLVAGTSGSGKSTLARRIAEASGARYQEIDALFHGPDWTPRPTFEADVDAFTSGDMWVIEWQYGLVRDLLAARADTLVFLDYRRSLVMSRVVRRTVRRRVRREELWNGNREAPLATIFTDRDHIVRWAWRTHSGHAAQVARAAAANPGLRVVRLRSPKAAERWLAGTFPGEA